MLYVLLILLTVVCARFAPRGELRATFFLAEMVVFDWIVCGLAYPPTALHRHLGISAPELWLIADVSLLTITTPIAIYLATKGRWFGIFLMLCEAYQVIVHLFHGSMTDGQYTWLLDRGLDAQIALFVMTGGKGAWDYVYRLQIHRSGGLGNGLHFRSQSPNTSP